MMKRWGILVIALALITGLGMADTGITPVPETQMFSVQTHATVIGTIDSDAEISWRISSAEPLNSGQTGLTGDGSTYYSTGYMEDTLSNGDGFISYAKTVTLDTASQTAGDNIYASKQIQYQTTADTTGRIMSKEAIAMTGTSTAFSDTGTRQYCGFGSSTTPGIPAFCTDVGSGSAIDMSVVDVSTETKERFITPGADFRVTQSHEISVTDLDGEPAKGRVEAYMNVETKEGSGNGPGIYETMKFRERTIADTGALGGLNNFYKYMSYESGTTR